MTRKFETPLSGNFDSPLEDFCKLDFRELSKQSYR